MDHEDYITHLKKFYEIKGSLYAFESKEELVFMMLFLHSPIENDDQLDAMMTNQNILEDMFINPFYPKRWVQFAKTTIDLFFQGVAKSLCETGNVRNSCQGNTLIMVLMIR